jgi:hypothetical protein
MCENILQNHDSIAKVPIDAQRVDLQNYDFVVIANFGV